MSSFKTEVVFIICMIVLGLLVSTIVGHPSYILCMVILGCLVGTIVGHHYINTRYVYYVSYIENHSTDANGSHQTIVGSVQVALGHKIKDMTQIREVQDLVLKETEKGLKNTPTILFFNLLRKE